jgi:hypothetical protein
MKRALHSVLVSVVYLTLLLENTPSWGQGVLIIVDPPVPTPLPRPIIWPPRPPHPIPKPRPVPEPPASYKIKELAVQARLVDQVARVQVSQTFVNTGSRQMEVSFVFPLPYDGAIDRLTFMVDGKEYEAKLLPKDEARAIYESYVRRNEDPALLEWIGTGMFKTSVFPCHRAPNARSRCNTTSCCARTARSPISCSPLDSQVHVAADRVGADPGLDRNGGRTEERLQPDARSRNDSLRRPTSHRQVRSEEPRADHRFPVVFDTAKGSIGCQRAELSAG